MNDPSVVARKICSANACHTRYAQRTAQRLCLAQVFRYRVIPMTPVRLASFAVLALAPLVFAGDDPALAARAAQCGRWRGPFMSRPAEGPKSS